MASTDIVTVPTGAYAILNHTSSEAAAIIAANLGDTEINEGNLPNVTFPTGGKVQWEVPTPFGAQLAPEVTGVIVHHKRVRAYWGSGKITGKPPLCSARDNKNGEGTPGGLCRDCPLSQWGSASRLEGADPDADGKACKEREIWFVLQESRALPLVISMPSGSLKNAEDFRVGFSSFLPVVPLTSIQTTITLVAKDGPRGPYAVAVPKFSAQLTPEDAAAAAAYAEQWAPMLEAAAVAMATETPAAGGKAADVDLDAPAAAPASASKAA